MYETIVIILGNKKYLLNYNTELCYLEDLKEILQNILEEYGEEDLIEYACDQLLEMDSQLSEYEEKDFNQKDNKEIEPYEEGGDIPKKIFEQHQYFAVYADSSNIEDLDEYGVEVEEIDKDEYDYYLSQGIEHYKEEGDE